eukprot:tig00000769_g4032.t1
MDPAQNPDVDADPPSEPPELGFNDQPFALDFHPTRNVCAVGLITGHVHIYEYAESGNKELASISSHRDSCRAVRFRHDGAGLYTASADRSIQYVDLAAGKSVGKMGKAHEAPITVLLQIDENMLTSGDDDGAIKLWDLRTQKCVLTYTENEDFIADMAYNADAKMLVAASGDGTLGVYHVRKYKLEAMSDNIEDELLSCALLKDGKKVVCGSQEGILQIWSWGDFGDVSDRFPGHPQSIDTIAKIDEDVICTGSSDGLIRVVSVHPNKLLGVVGEHGEFPIERVALSGDKRVLGSCSHDNTVKFWNIAYLMEEDGKGEEEEEGEGRGGGMEVEGAAAAAAGPARGGGGAARAAPDSDSDSDSDGGGGGGGRKKKRKQKRGSAAAANAKPQNSFFKDL